MFENLKDDQLQNNGQERVREIPVLHERPRMQQHQYQYQRHDPRTMPQPQTNLGFAPMPQPHPFYQSMPQPQRINRQKTTSPQQPSAKLPKTSQQTQATSKERLVPIQVVHQKEPQNNFAESPKPTEKPKPDNVKNNVVPKQVEIEVTKSQPDVKPVEVPKPTSPVPKKPSMPEKDETTDPGEDHRVVAARKKLNTILEDLESLESEVNTFSGSPKEKLYLKLEEQLVAKLLRLDEVNANGSPKEELIRNERKATVKRIQQTLDLLELKGMSDDSTS